MMDSNSRDEILQQLSNVLTQGPSKTKNIAVLWDVENVTPSVDSLFIDGFFEYINQFGRLNVARAFADWNLPNVKRMAEELASHHFQLIHTPRARKNSSDMVMITHGMEMAMRYSFLDMFVLITGDSDFRPFISSLRSSGMTVHVICDVKTASTDLLILADEFVDFRELIPGGEEEDEGSTTQSKTVKTKATTDDELETWYENLAEAILLMEKEGKTPSIGTVKIKMKMLNTDFDEKKLGFNKWSNFVNKATDEGFVKVKGGMGTGTLQVPSKIKHQITKQRPRYIKVLIETLKELSKNKGDWVPFSDVGKLMRKKGVTPDDEGFSKFKQLFQAAEARDVVETKAEGFVHYIRLT